MSKSTEITPEREFNLTERAFKKISQLVYQHAGIKLASHKKDMVYNRLAKRLRQLGLAGFDDYLSLINNQESDEWQTFINALTTNVTSFFREPHHFPILAAHALSLHASNPGGTICIWCSASSTGEEAYSIAMTMIEAFDSMRPPVRIIASDIDTKALLKAEQGIYNMDQVQKLSEQQLQRFFLKGTNENSGQVKIRPEIRKLVMFRQVNLQSHAWQVRGVFDAIFCRNVMIYFDKPTQAAILKRFASHMKPEALLFSGHSESLAHVTDIFEPQGKTVYRVAPAYHHLSERHRHRSL